MADLLVILGSVTAPGRLHGAMSWMVEAARGFKPGLSAELVNLGDCKIAFADGRAPEAYGDDTAAVVKRVTEARAVVLATPVYRASYTGALKNLLDQLPVEALCGKPCGVVAMGATHHHYLGADWHLRDVLTWFGALVAPVGVYLSSADFSAGAMTEAARNELLGLARTLVRLAELATAGAALEPTPLAARRS